MSYVRQKFVRRRQGLGALLTTSSKTAALAPTLAKVVTAVAPAPQPIPVKVVAPAPIQVYTPPVLTAPKVAVSLVTPISAPAPAPLPMPIVPAKIVAPVSAPEFVNPIVSAPKGPALELVQATPVVQAPTFVNPIVNAPKGPALDLIQPIPVAPVVQAPTFTMPLVAGTSKTGLELVQAPAPQLIPATVVAPPAPPTTTHGQAAPSWVVGANCKLGTGKAGTYDANGNCYVNYTAPSPGAKGSDPMSMYTDALNKKKAADASKAAVSAALKKGLVKVKAKPQQIPVRPLGPAKPGFVNPLASGRGTPGGQVVTPSVVALNCGAGQRLVDGACQAEPGTSISPTTGTVAQPAAAQATSLPGPVTYSQWSARDGQTMMGPAPMIESTPAEDEQGVPPVVAPAPMSTGTKVAMVAGGAVVGFFVLKALGVFKP